MLCVINAPGFDLASCWISLTPDTHTHSLSRSLALLSLFVWRWDWVCHLCQVWAPGYEWFQRVWILCTHHHSFIAHSFCPFRYVMACFCVWDILSFLISLQLLTNHSCALGSLVKNKNKKQFYRLAVEVKYADLQLWWMVELISKNVLV